MIVKIINKSKHQAPDYQTKFSSGMDLRADIDKSIYLKPLERKIIKTGIYISLPIGFEAQIRPRSGLAAKKGITVLNSPGTIDADYRGEICVILVNISNEIFKIKDGQGIAQLIISKYERVSWQEVNILDKTDRGNNGFGSTGV